MTDLNLMRGMKIEPKPVLDTEKTRLSKRHDLLASSVPAKPGGVQKSRFL